MTTNTTSAIRTTSPDSNILSQTQYRVYDGLLAAGFILCFLVGLPGNCLSLTYFIRSKKQNLPTLLYMTACCFDIISSVIHLPVTANLLNNRNPGLLGYEVCCMIWHSLAVLVKFMSMYVVMILSVTRAIVITFPFYKIKRKTVFITIFLTIPYILLWDTIYMANGQYYYSSAFTFCEFDWGENSITELYNIHYSVWVGIPPLIVFLSTIIAIFNLGKQNQMNNSQENCQNASKTIIFFAIVFLMCYFPTFLNAAFLTITDFSSRGYVYFYKNTFLFFYSWQISDIFCFVLNSALNPILYLCRFKEMRKWLKELFS